MTALSIAILVEIWVSLITDGLTKLDSGRKRTRSRLNQCSLVSSESCSELKPEHCERLLLWCISAGQVSMALSTSLCKTTTRVEHGLGHGRLASNADQILTSNFSTLLTSKKAASPYRHLRRMQDQRCLCQCQLQPPSNPSSQTSTEHLRSEPTTSINGGSPRSSRRHILRNVGAALTAITLSAAAPGVSWAEPNHNVRLADVENTELRQALEAAGKQAPF